MTEKSQLEEKAAQSEAGSPATTNYKTHSARQTQTRPKQKTFRVPNIADWESRWMNQLPFYLQLEVDGAIGVYHQEHISEWMEAVQQQLQTGDNQAVIGFFKKKIGFAEERLNRLGVSYISFNDFYMQESYRQRYGSQEGHCVHDSLYNAVTAGYSIAAFLARDGKGPNFVQVFMVEEERGTSDNYNPKSELNKPLNRIVLGRGLYHNGLENQPRIAQVGSEWHTLLKGAFDENLPVGIIPGYGDDSELRSASPRAVLVVQNHGTSLDTKVLRGLQIHANYVAERIMPSSPAYLSTPKS